MTDSDTISKTIFINATPEIVWEYLTQKDKLALWFHPADADLQLDADYALRASDSGDKLCWGRVLEMQPPSHMIWSFTVQPLQGAVTTVRWSLQPVANGTRITLVHSGVGKAAGDAAMGLLLALDKGWDEHFAALRAQLNNTSAEV